MEPSTRHRLVAAWLADGLAPSETAALLRAARSDPALRRELAILQEIERLLRHQGATRGPRDAFEEEVIARLTADDQDGGAFCSGVIARIGTRGARPHPRDFSWLGRWGSWAAALAVVAALGYLCVGPRVPGRGRAVVAGSEAIRWAAGQSPLGEGHPLGRGPIAIDAGFLRIRFASGASVILEGPARLDVLGKNGARLHEGRAVADVPPEASGFSIESPDGRIIDLGTRFGLEVGTRGRATEVHVLEGLVRASVPGETVARELRESQALRIEARTATAMAADGTRFLTRLPPRGASPAPYVHWSLDEASGQAVRAEGPLAGAAAARLESLIGGGGPDWIPGRFGSALDFDGAGDFVATDFGGISGDRARTVALWAKVPADWEPVNGFALVSWGAMRIPGAAWQVSINPLPEDGPIGRLRAGVHTSHVIGTRDLRDGQWHHIAAVLFDGEGPRDTTHILLFVDGQLEPAERKGIREVNTEVGRPGSTAVALGRNMDARPRHGGRVFRGALDEVFIFDAALSQESIVRLMRENKPPKPEPKAHHHERDR